MEDEYDTAEPQAHPTFTSSRGLTALALPEGSQGCTVDLSPRVKSVGKTPLEALHAGAWRTVQNIKYCAEWSWKNVNYSAKLLNEIFQGVILFNIYNNQKSGLDISRVNCIRTLISNITRGAF